MCDVSKDTIGGSSVNRDIGIGMLDLELRGRVSVNVA